MNINNDISVESKIREVFNSKLCGCAYNASFNVEELKHMEDYIQELIELFRELKRQNRGESVSVSVKETVTLNKNDVSDKNDVLYDIFIGGNLVCSGTLMGVIATKLKDSYGELSPRYKHFLNFKHNLQYFKDIDQKDWNGKAVINQKCDANGKFQNLNVGLNNIGATCFMNSTLQCLKIILANYFSNPEAVVSYKTLIDQKKESGIEGINTNGVLTEEFGNLIGALMQQVNPEKWKNVGKSFSPSDFRQLVEEINPLFKKGATRRFKRFYNLYPRTTA